MTKQFKLNETGEKVAISRYYQKNEKGEIIEGWGDLVLRVVNHVCKNEPQEFKNKMLQLIGKTEFLPNSPCLVNAGRKTKKAGLMACYVSKAPEDTWKSMCETIENFGDVARAGGGCGVFLGNIRPAGSSVFGSTHAKACGPVEHMRMISEVMASITQGGFRGMAALSSLNVSHPDILSFIQCKQKERALKTYLREDIFKHYPQIINNIEPQLKIVLDKFLYNFNISVLINDKFMEAVENDFDWDLSFGGKAYQTLKAKEIFDLIVENAWKNGDPGCLFEDTINNNSPYRFSGQKINASNPCQPNWVYKITKNGLRQLKDINVGDEIWSENGWVTVEKKWSTGIKEVFAYETSVGTFYGTENHRIVQNGEKTEAKDAEAIDILTGPDSSDKLLDDQDIMDGLVLGDGSVHKSSNNLVFLCIGQDDHDYFKSEVSSLIVRETKINRDYAYVIKTTITDNELPHTYKRRVPERFLTGNQVRVRGFLRGLYSANGSVCGDRITLKTSSPQLREDVQLMLSSIGIKSYFTTNKPTIVEFENGCYECKESYDINITVDRERFHKNIGFLQKYKTEKVELLLNNIGKSKYSSGYKRAKTSYEVKSIKELDKEEVFDITVSGPNHTYWSHGLNVSNCGEQLIPSNNSNCNLGSIDVSKFYNEKTNDVDWDRLKEVIQYCFQFLDDVIDAHDYPAESFKQWGMENRPVGLGIMGFADLLLKLKIKYGSSESIVFAEKLMKFFADTTHAKSVELGKERGTPKCCQYKELDYRRTITTTSIAPTGTIALLAGCSSSIEPIFSPTIFRHDNTGSYEIKHPDSESEWFACALDGDGGPREVKYQEHIQIQAAFQKYCNSGISKTINLPSTATIDDVKNAYKLAWHSGCFAKGNSVYTSLGLKDVSDIKVNDLVYGHDGKLHKVTYAFDLPIEKRSFTKLEICSHEGIEATDEHPILVVLLDKKEDRKKWENRNKQIEWKPISEIKIGDHVLIPKLKEFQETKKDINVSSLISSNYIIEQNRIYPSRPLPWKKDKITICPNSQSIPANVVIDDNFCSFIGWFIAEGHFNDDSYVRLTLNPYEEQHIGDEICKYVKETFGLIGTQEIIHSNNGKSLRLQFASKIFSEFLQSLVGRGSYNKHLPNWFLNIDINKREQILKSYHSGDKGVTMSPQLSKDLFLGWLSIGKTPRFQKNYGEGYEVVDCLTNQTGKPIGEFLAYRVKSISRRISDEKVYNFAVEDVDSYLVNGIASHNCKGITIYRNNSKTTQVLNLTNKIATQPKTAQIDRPPELPCDIYKLRADGIDWHIIIGLKDGNPYELFAVNGGKELPKNGFVVKKKKRHYSLLDTSREVLLENIIEFENKIDSKVGLETRRFSLELRHGIPPKYIVEQIDKSNDVITSFSKAAARIFKKYYLEQNTVSGALCPECAKEGKESKLIYVSGCSKCNTCSYSGCG